MSHPAWVRGLKQFNLTYLTAVKESHPAWVRGLKHHKDGFDKPLIKSHPAWVRGLKLLLCVRWPPCVHVAPCVGAWIETRRKG